MIDLLHFARRRALRREIRREWTIAGILSAIGVVAVVVRVLEVLS